MASASVPFFSASGPLAPCLRSVSDPQTTYLSEAANRRRGPWHLCETPTPGNFETDTKNKYRNNRAGKTRRQVFGLNIKKSFRNAREFCTFGQ